MSIETNSPGLRDALNNEITPTVDTQTQDASKAAIQDNSTQRDAKNNNNCSNPENNVVQNNVVQNNEVQNNVVQNMNNLNIRDAINVPILGYEVMEERARFTIYKLKVEDSVSGRSWLVFRRYTDFVRLCARVQAEAPGATLPLPAKRWLRDNFNPGFLEERAKGLQVFVDTIVKRLPNNKRVREFFCLDDPPQTCVYQPEVQAVYGALEDSVNILRSQLQQRDNTIAFLQQRLASVLESKGKCDRCGNTSES